MPHAQVPTPGSEMDQDALLTAQMGEVFHLSAAEVEGEFFLSLDSPALCPRTVDFSLDEAEAWHIRWGNVLAAARRLRDEYLAAGSAELV